MRSIHKLLLVCAVGVASSIAPRMVLAQHPVHWKVTATAQSVQIGKLDSLRVSAAIDSGWHIYALTQSRPPVATSITLGPQDLLKARPPRQPTPLHHFDDAFGIEAETFEKSVVFTIPFSVVAGTSAGAHEVQAAVRYQACTSEVCLPPQTENFTTQVSVAAASKIGERRDTTVGAGVVGARTTDGHGSADTTVAVATVDPVERTEPGVLPEPGPPVPVTTGASVDAVTSTVEAQGATPAAPDTGLWAYLMLAAAMGALALLTPCVFPMIPITVSYFTKRESGVSDARTRATVIRDAAIYGAGIVCAFSALGLLLAVVFGATGINRFAANPWVNLTVAALFVTFGLDLIGAIQLRLPWQLLTRMSRHSDGSGVFGLLFMGLAFTVTTFTCTVPFVGTLLVTAASGQWLWPIAGMVAFSSVFALPFVVLAMFPALLTSFPSSGSWMNALKVTLGVIELGAALKFLSNADLVWQLGLLHRQTVLAIWIALAVLASLYLMGQIHLRSDGELGGLVGIGVGRMLAGGMFIAVALFLAAGMFGTTTHVGAFEAFLPPPVYPGDEVQIRHTGPGVSPTHQLTWNSDYQRALSDARATGRPIFIDFTGYTCTNCRWMEAYVFSRADIRGLFEKYTLARLYTDGDGVKYEQNQHMQLTRFGTVALPFYAIIAPDGRAIATFPGLTRQPAKFASFLQRGLQAAQRVDHES